MTRSDRSEGEALLREGKRAVTNRLMRSFGYPAFVIGLGIVAYNVVVGLAAGEILRSLVFLAVFGTLLFAVGRRLWRLVQQ